MRIQEFSSHHICSNCDLKINKKINRMYSCWIKVTMVCEIGNFQLSVLPYLGPLPHSVLKLDATRKNLFDSK